MLKEISNLQKEEEVFKLIPDSMDFILGKSKVEYLEAVPLVEVEFSYSKPINKMLKRLLDLGIALPLFLGLFLILSPGLLFKKYEYVRLNGFRFYKNIKTHSWKNTLKLLGYVISGKISLVGVPIVQSQKESSSVAKKGITGLVQISTNKIQTEEDKESFILYYLQNYSIWMDIDILIKTLFNKISPIDILAESEENKD